MRLPLGTDLSARAALVGLATDTERFDAFTDYDISVKAIAHYRRDFGSGSMLHLRTGWSGGASVLQDGGPGNFSTLEYVIQLGSRVEQLNLIGSLSGRYLLSGRTFHMSRIKSTGLNRTTFQFAAAASVEYPSVRPGVFFTLLLDDDVNDESRQFVDNFLTGEVQFVFGFNIVFKLK